MDLTTTTIVSGSLIAAAIVAVIGLLLGANLQKPVHKPAVEVVAWCSTIVFLVAALCMAFDAIASTTGFLTAGFVLVVSALFSALSIGCCLFPYTPR